MDDTERVSPAPSDRSSGAFRLSASVTRLNRPAFAVVDGGHWSNSQAELTKQGLSARSLFLGAGRDAESAGPWLVALDQRADASSVLLAVVDDKPAAVFWGCQLGEEALWRHLRTINQVRLAARDDDEDEVESGIDELKVAEANSARSEVVLFRHWDPRALSMVLPILDETQYARVLGPADEAVFHDPKALGGAGLRRMARLPSLPAAPHGMLSLDADQVAALDEGMQQRSRERIVRYLQDYAPDQTSHLDQARLHAAVAGFQVESRSLGVHGEQATGLWAYMRLTSRIDLSREPLVRRYLGDPAFGSTPEVRMEALFDQRTRAVAHSSGGRSRSTGSSDLARSGLARS